jgi:hypothetical protein
MSRSASLALVVTLSAAPIAALLAQQVPPAAIPVAPQAPGAPRDPNQPQVRQVPIGTATISGTVLAADSGRPLTRARVSLSGSATVADTGRAGSVGAPAPAGGRGGPVTPTVNGMPVSGSLGLGRTVVTDSQGQFTFAKLPAGNYTINVQRDQYLGTSYGQKKYNRPGAVIPLTDGQRLSVKIPMLRGGIVTGQVIGDDGEPLMNASVRAMRYDMSSGFKRLQENRSAQSDDRGVYRLFGLQPGEYLIAATPNPDFNMSERSLIDAAAVESAVAAATVHQTLPGQPTTISVPLAPPGDNNGPQPGFAPTFYPSANSPVGATSVVVTAGEEKTGIDIPVQPIRTSNIQGTVLSPSGPSTAVQVYIVADDPLATGTTFSSSARTTPDGKFTLRNVTPGQYTIYAQTVQVQQNTSVVGGMVTMVQTPQRTDDTPRLWGRVQVSVDGQSTPNVAIAMQQGRSISGRVVFETQTMPDLTRTRPMVTVTQAPASQQVSFGPSPQAQVGPDGRFTLQGLGPGKYILRASGIPSTPAAPIAQKSAVVNGQDTMDIPLDFTADQDFANATITMTDRLTELGGTLSDGSGKLGSEYMIIVVAAESRFWTPLSRRIQTTRPSPDGRYMLRNLPPGDYMIAALTDLEPGSQYDPEFLKALAGASVRVTLSEGEKRTQDLRVAK